MGTRGGMIRDSRFVCTGAVLTVVILLSSGYSQLISAAYNNSGSVQLNKVLQGEGPRFNPPGEGSSDSPPTVDCESAKGRQSFQLSEDYFKRAIAWDSNNAQAYRNLGHVYAELGEDLVASKMLSESIRLRPNDPLSHFALGNIHAHLGEREKAIMEWGVAHAYHVLSRDFWDQGNLHLQKGQAGHAKVEFENLIEIALVASDTYWLAEAYRGLGYAYAGLGDWRNAIRAFECSVEANHNATALAELGRIYAQQGELERGTGLILEAIARSPQDYNYYMILAEVYRDAGEYENAAKWYQEAAMLAPPHNSTPVHGIAQSYLSLNQPLKAVSILKPWLETNRRDAELHHLLGDAYSMLGLEDLAAAEHSIAASLSESSTSSKCSP